MKRFFLISLGLISAGAFAQDTIAYNNKSEIVDFKSSDVATYQISEAFSGDKFDSISRTFNKDGQIKTERTFDWDPKKQKRVYQGMHKHWYDSGKPFYTENFNHFPQPPTSDR